MAVSKRKTYLVLPISSHLLRETNFFTNFAVPFERKNCFPKSEADRMLLPFEGKFNLKINKIMKQLLIYVVAMMAALFAAMFVHAEEESGLAKQMAVAEQAVAEQAVAEQAVAEQAVAVEQAAVIEQTAVTGQETTSVQAAAVQQPMGMTLRIGNSYIVNHSVMNSRAYMGYLQNTSPEVYGRFKSGYVTAMTGWGLFAAGPILSLCIGLPVWLSGDPCMYDHYDSHKVALHAGFGIGSIVVGMGAFVSGITCLGVGYGRMHRSADIYNFHCANKPTTYWSLQSSANGLGLALHF